MRLLPLLLLIAINACHSPSAEDSAFFLDGEKRSVSNPPSLFFYDAVSRLSPAERQNFKRSGDKAGFTFTGEIYTFIVLVTLRTDVLNHAPDPVFCYDKQSHRFVQRL